jgi:hypothetical protein
MTVSSPAITLQVRDHLKVMAPYTPAGRVHPLANMTSIRVLRRDRLGGLVHEYSQVA